MPDAVRYAARVGRDIVEVTGPEATAYLQGQLSQDVQVLAPGGSALSWVLSPQGKVDALIRVTRLADDRWLLDTDTGWGEAVVARLDRFKLRTKADICRLSWQVLALRSAGPVVDNPVEVGVAAGLAAASAAASAGERGGGLVIAVPVSWAGWWAVDLLGPEPTLPDGWRLADPAEYEADRVANGVPVMGRELDERTIPAETGLVAQTVSFTKGCYTGQELVARVDSRGSNVPRRLRRLRPEAAVAAGSTLAREDGEPAGTVTSVAMARDGGWVALGYTKRSVEVPTVLYVEGLPVAVEATEP